MSFLTNNNGGFLGHDTNLAHEIREHKERKQGSRVAGVAPATYGQGWTYRGVIYSSRALAEQAAEKPLTPAQVAWNARLAKLKGTT